MEDAGLEEGPRQSIQLDVLVSEVVDHMQIIAQEGRVTLESDFPAPCTGAGNRDRPRQLLFNLNDNAIKYTPPGGKVTVRERTAPGRVGVEVGTRAWASPPSICP